jgi:hypothetical protein
MAHQYCYACGRHIQRFVADVHRIRPVVEVNLKSKGECYDCINETPYLYC